MALSTEGKSAMVIVRKRNGERSNRIVRKNSTLIVLLLFLVGVIRCIS